MANGISVDVAALFLFVKRGATSGASFSEASFSEASSETTSGASFSEATSSGASSEVSDKLSDERTFSTNVCGTFSGVSELFDTPSLFLEVPSEDSESLSLSSEDSESLSSSSDPGKSSLFLIFC